jgi:monofunctional biosynthetic peptidoglycan transglycosylase
MEKNTIDFSAPDEQALWKIINDAVMGGVSSSRISIINNDAALFHGVISLENYGGFTSMRSLPREFELTGLTKLILRIKGDGKGYRLRLRTDEAYEGIAYQEHFSTEQDTWITLCLSFETFTPVFRGRVIEDAQSLNVSRIQRLGFMIAYKQAGPFRLEIALVTAYS